MTVLVDVHIIQVRSLRTMLCECHETKPSDVIYDKDQDNSDYHKTFRVRETLCQLLELTSTLFPHPVAAVEIH